MLDTTPKEFEEKVVEVNRTSKKTQGGNRIGFGALVVVGNRKGRVGAAIGKAGDVSSAVRKAASMAKKNMITMVMAGTTIPHEVRIKYGAAKIILRPAPAGSGIIAGGSVRAVMDAVGIKDISAKMLGTNNKITNVYATIEALKKFKGSRG